jgi:hypothetical protein
MLPGHLTHMKYDPTSSSTVSISLLPQVPQSSSQEVTCDVWFPPVRLKTLITES